MQVITPAGFCRAPCVPTVAYVSGAEPLASSAKGASSVQPNTAPDDAAISDQARSAGEGGAAAGLGPVPKARAGECMHAQLQSSCT